MKKKPDLLLTHKIHFQRWLTQMGWDKYGGLKKASEALGKGRSTVEAYKAGRLEIPVDTRLAMSGLATKKALEEFLEHTTDLSDDTRKIITVISGDLKPWGEGFEAGHMVER